MVVIGRPVPSLMASFIMVVIGRRLLRHDPARLLRDDTAALFPLRALRVASVVLPQPESAMHVKASPSKHDNERQ
jgi:hypothetical protein